MWFYTAIKHQAADRPIMPPLCTKVLKPVPVMRVSWPKTLCPETL